MNNAEVERLPYWLSQPRGIPMGSPNTDWLRAEALIERQYRWLELSTPECPFSSPSMSKRTR